MCACAPARVCMCVSLSLSLKLCVCLCVCVRPCVRACVRACVCVRASMRSCMRACARARVCSNLPCVWLDRSGQDAPFLTARCVFFSLGPHNYSDLVEPAGCLGFSNLVDLAIWFYLTCLT